MDGIRNAIIQAAWIADAGCRGILTASLTLDYGVCGQSFGGQTLYIPNDYSHHTQHWNYAGHFIWRCMEIGGVSEWESLKGRPVRVRVRAGLADAVGHIFKEDWFCPRDDFERMADKEPTREQK